MGHAAVTVFSELANLTPIYCSGVAGVLVEGGNIHVSYYQETRLGDGSVDRVIVLRIIVPSAAVSQGRAMVDFEIAAAEHQMLACPQGRLLA